MKKLIFVLAFLPSIAFAQRMGGIRSGDDVSLSSNTILNNPSGAQESKTANISSGTITEFNTKNAYFYNTATGFGSATNSGGILTSNSSFSPYGIHFYNTGGQLSISNYSVDASSYVAVDINATTRKFSVWDYTNGTNLLFSAESTGLKTGVPLYLYSSIFYGGTYTVIQSSSGMPGSYTLTLPLADGTTGQALTTDGAGQLSFETITGSGSGPFTIARATTTVSHEGFDINNVGNLRSSGTISTTGDITASGVVGSHTGNFVFGTSTITIAAPPTDTLNRTLILNNGAGSWPLAGSLNSTQTFTGGNVFVSTLVVPSGTAPTVDQAGAIGFDTTDAAMIGHDGAREFIVARSTIPLFDVTISSGTGWDTQTFKVYTAPTDMGVTVTSCKVSVSSGTSVTFNFDERAWTSPNTTGTNLTSSPIVADSDGATVTVFSNASIAAGAQIHWVTSTSASSGSVGALNLYCEGMLDVE